MSSLPHLLRGRFRSSIAPATFLASAFAAHALFSSSATLGLREGRWLAVLGATAVTFAGTFAVASLAIVRGLTWRGADGRFHVSPWTGWLVCGTFVAFIAGLLFGNRVGHADPMWPAGVAIGGWIGLVIAAWAVTRLLGRRRDPSW